MRSNLLGVIYYSVLTNCELDNVIMWRSNNDTLYFYGCTDILFFTP